MSRRDRPDHVERSVAIVLAAGAGSRYSDKGHKLTAVLPMTPERPAESVFRRSLATCLAGTDGPVIVVTGRLDANELGIDDELARLTVAHNPHWEAGQMGSVHTGLQAAAGLGADVAVIGLADQPGITPAAWGSVAAASTPQTPIAVATYAGRRGNPVALHRTIWSRLPDDGDEGARSLMRIHPELVREVPCFGSPTDIDTVEDLRRWQSS